MVSAVILSAVGPFTDHFHGLAGTTERLEELLRTHGLDVRVVSEIPEAIDAIENTDLLVTNIAGPNRPAAEEQDLLGSALESYWTAGGPVLALHSSIMSLQHVPQWHTILGGRWNVGVSFHPPIGSHLVQVATDAHPTTAGLGDFAIFDERYTDLILSPEATPLITHIDNGVKHMLSWAHEGDGRAIYDGLGHGVESYDYPEHRQFLTQSIDWLLGEK